MTLNLTEIADGIFVTSQVSPGDFKALALQGIRSIINNRPDGEESSQPKDADLHAGADAEGLFYAYLPVAGASFDNRTILRMRALVGELPRPILAFCRTGTRSARLYHATTSVHQQAQENAVPQQEQSVKANVGSMDRAARVVVGVALLGAAVTGSIGAWGLLGVVPLATGMFRFCPAYLPFGFSTRRTSG